MILSFRTENKKTKKPTGFVEKILKDIKIHTLRAGHRWEKGKIIHMATGVRTKFYNQFNKDRPDLQVCKDTQEIKIILNDNENLCEVIVDGRKLLKYEMIALAYYDGFDSLTDFFEWFRNEPILPDQIIHWTDFKY